MTEQLLARLESKTVTDTGNGEISGLAAVYGNVDLQDDQFEVGSFAKTASDWSRAKVKIPLLDWHGDSLSRIIGSVVELKSIVQGLWFRAVFASSPEAQAARQLAREGHLSGVSVGWLPVRQSSKWIGGRMVRVLHEARVHEISLTPIPANPEAQLASVKSLGGGYDVTDDAEVGRQLAELEVWLLREQAGAFAAAPSEVWQHLTNVKAAGEQERQLAGLEAWARANWRPRDLDAEAREVERQRRDRANAYSNGLADWKAQQATIPGCGRCQWCKAGAPSACVYR